jgi:DNA-binding GntR family transcriptional regulator
MPLNWDDYSPRTGTAMPVYRQLAAWIEERISDGSLPPGTRIPSDRELADLVHHSVETTAKAKRLLVEKGLLESAVGVGTYVVDRHQD